LHDWYSPINRYWLSPLYFWYHRNPRLARLKVLERNQYLSQAELQDIQLQGLRHLLAHAATTVPYYRDLFAQHGVGCDTVQSAQDLTRIPVLTKHLMQDNLQQLKSTAYRSRDLFQDSSGGSTGTPTVFYKDLLRTHVRAADQIRHDQWSGWQLGDPFALIWGASHDLTGLHSFRRALVNKVVLRTIQLDAFDMSETVMEGFVARLEKINPPMILGYANALFQFATFLRQRHPQHRIHPKGIVSSAETLTAEARGVIQEVFQCPVLNRYGSREVGLVASECPERTGLHINMDNVVVEILGPDSDPVPAGESGDIVVTDLWNYGMPLIRYRMEDRGHFLPETCSCGRTLPLMGQVEGRRSDFLVAADGKLVHGEYYTHLLYGIPAIRKFQLVQESLELVTLKLELGGSLEEGLLQNLERTIADSLGPQVKVQITQVDDIPLTASGKFLFTISKVR
jgi:phenylacetate-CoA ligase